MQTNLQNNGRRDGNSGSAGRSLLFLLAAFFSILVSLSAPPATAAETSPNGTRGSIVVDGGGTVWSVDDQGHILRNGVWTGGAGTELLFVNLSVYGVAPWGVYRWDNLNGWMIIGNDPAAVLALVADGRSVSDGVRQVATTGSIQRGSNRLTVGSAGGFNVGDFVIVEIGNEPGHGQRGTRGVGGTWPATSYPSEAQLFSDGGQQNGLFAWAEDSGNVFQWANGNWVYMGDNRAGAKFQGSYYVGKAIPRSLQAQIVAISGNTLTLDAGAAESVSDATVYLDTAPILNKLIANGSALALPAGRFPVGGVVWVNGRGGFELAGQGTDSTTIFSPKGVPSAQIQVVDSPNSTVRDLTLQGNFRDQGFGLNWGGSTPAGTGQPVTETDVPLGAAFPRGILFISNSQNGVAQDLRVIDVAQQALGVIYAENVWGRRIENIQNDLLRSYVTWQYQWVDTQGGGCEDCQVRSTYVIPGFEAFRTSGVQFIRPKGQNALFALNGSGPWMVVDADLRFTANSLHPDSDPLAASYSQPILNVNTNAGITSQSTAGGTIRNVTITQEDYLNAAGDNLIGIYVNESNPNIRIESSAYSAPDYRDTSAAYGAVGLYSKGVNTTVNGMTVVGKARPQYPNIVLERGSGQGCSAQLVQGCAP